jgi:hypothetical protein
MVNILTSLALPTAVVWAVGGSSSSDSSDAVCSAHQNANVDGTSTCDNGRIAIISGVSLGRSADPMAASVLIFATIILFMKLVHSKKKYKQAAMNHTTILILIILSPEPPRHTTVSL